MALSSFIDGLADTSPEAKKARDSFAGNVKDFVVGAARDIPRAGAVVAATLTGIETDDPTKRNKLSRFVFGDEPIKSLKGQNPDIEKNLQQFGVPANVAKGAAPVVGLFGLGLNLYPGSPGKGELFKKLALEGDEKVVQTILKKEVKSLSDNAAKEIAPQIAKATTRKEVDDILAKALRPSSKALSKEASTFLKNNPEPAALGTLREYVDALDIDDAAALPEGFKNIDALAATAKKQLQQYGVPTSKLTKPKLANLAEEILNKTGDVPKFRERGYITSVKDKFSGVNASGTYIPRSTDNLAIKARNLVNDDIGAARNAVAGQISDETVAIASELVKKYGDDAAKATSPEMKNFLYDEAAKVANEIAPKLTEAGRTVQAASILGRMTPEGQLRFASQEIARYNLKNPGKQIPGLTGEQAGKILTDMKRIQAMPDGMDKARELFKLQQEVAKLIPTPLWKKLTTVWKAGLLTGVKTTGLNLLSNASHAALETAKDIPAAVVDSVASLFTGQRTKTFNVTGAGKGIKEGFERGWDHLKTGFDERNIAGKLDYKKINFGKGPIAKIFQGYTEAVFRVMGAGDQPFYYGALSRSLADQATAKAINEGFKGKEIARYAQHLIENPTEEMLRMAVADASTAVFQNSTLIGEAGMGFKNKSGVVGELITPFVKTPASVITQVLKYTPAGPVQEIFSQVSKKQFNQRAFSEAVGRGLVGTGVLALGYKMAENGMISLDRPKTEREQKLWELEGRKPNSILIDGKWRSPMVLGPGGTALLVAAHLQQALKETGSPTAAMVQTFFGTTKSLMEQTFLTGVNQAMGALSEPSKAQYYFENLAGSVVPTLASDVARATDPLERRPEGAVDRIKSRTPGLRQEVEPKVDVLGNEIERIGNPLEVLADPTRPQKAVSTPVIDEFRRLFNAGYKVSPTLLGDKKGYKILSKEQNTELWKRSGEILQGKLNNLFKDERYQELEDDKKAKLVEQFVEKSKISARAQTVLEITDGMVGNELKEKLSELKKDGLLTRDVFNLYVKIR